LPAATEAGAHGPWLPAMQPPRLKAALDFD
jgi:hypothetical protein